MDNYINEDVLIGLLDFEKAFDYMNRPIILDMMMNDNIGNLFLKNLARTYENTCYIPKLSCNELGNKIHTDHGVTRGRNSSCNLFSYYISDMPRCLEIIDTHDFMDPLNLLQLADDSATLASSLQSLFVKIYSIIMYSNRKCLQINYDQNKYFALFRYPYPR